MMCIGIFYRFILLLLFATFILFLMTSRAFAFETENPYSIKVETQTFVDPICDKFFGLTLGTARFPWDGKYLNKEYCDAVKDLVRRYQAPGPCSSKGLSNPSIDSIIKLNPAFAVALDKALVQMSGKITITSAFRTPEGQRCANESATDSSHTYGCAVDIGSSKSICDTACQWIKSHPNTGIQVRADPKSCVLGSTPGECNHVEPTDYQACKNKAPGGGVVPGKTPVAGTGMPGTGSPGGAQTTPQQCIIYGGKLLCSKSTASITSGCVTQNGIKYCDNSNPYSPFGSNSLFGGNSSMGSMMMGMQLGQGLGSLLGGLFGGSGSTNTPQPPPAALPPAPLPVTTPITTVPTTTGSSTIEALIAALNNPSAATSTPVITIPVIVGSSTVGELQASSPTFTTTDASSSAAVTIPSITLAGGTSTSTTSSATVVSSSQSASSTTSTVQALIDSLNASIVALKDYVAYLLGL